MGIIPLSITTICYFWVTADLIARGNYPMALAFFAYATANIGFIWAIYR